MVVPSVMKQSTGATTARERPSADWVDDDFVHLVVPLHRQEDDDRLCCVLVHYPNAFEMSYRAG